MANISTNDAPAFAAWAILSNPNGMTEDEVKKALVSNGIEIKPPVAKGTSSTKRGALEIGEVVIVDGSKCVNSNNMALCKSLSFSPTNPLYLVVKDVVRPVDINSKCSVVLSPLTSEGRPTRKTFIFEADYPARISVISKKIQKAQKNGDSATEQTLKEELREKSLTPHSGLGVYRTGFSSLGSLQKYISDYDSSTKFVVVYERDTTTQVPKMRSEFLRDYSSRSVQQSTNFGEFDDQIEDLKDYASRFYEAPIRFGALSSKGNSLYFGMDTRRSRGANSIMSPTKGKVYYISPVHSLPNSSVWKSDLRERLEDMAQDN
jgi:hypothetical protein